MEKTLEECLIRENKRRNGNKKLLKKNCTLLKKNNLFLTKNYHNSGKKSL